MEIVSITEYSKETNCEISNPTDESNLVVRNSIIIPTEDSLDHFINCELFDYLSPNFDTSDNDRLRECLRNLLIAVIETNIDFILTQSLEAPNS
ncbi:MAG: hypothetical protein A2V93_05350 [Ignavibacteria bacterium RBG_16_34_14]|nr:MAG: hypothetical protein A2V93_05350 [Ignavibacteria bacterium RBG_16_34_14]